MGFLDFFKIDKESSEVNYLKHLIKVAMSDGKFDDAENQFISKIASKLHISETEVEEIKKDINKIRFREPEDSKARFQLIFDLVWLMMIDDEMDDNEISICTKVAQKLGYEADIVDDLVKAIQENLKEKEDRDVIYERILKSIK